MSQTDRILQMLRSRPVYGIKNYEFTDAHILKYSSRISELRKTYTISCERLYKKGKATSTFVYRLVQPPKPKQDKSHKVDNMTYEITGHRFRNPLNKLRRYLNGN